MASPLSEDLLEEFFKGASTAVVGLSIISRDLQFVRVNETLAAMNGLSVNEHLGQPVDYVLPELAPIIQPLLQSVFVTGQPISNIEVTGEVLSQPGIQRDWLVTYIPIRDRTQQLTYVGTIVIEITERKRLLRQLQQANQDLARSNHELEQFAYAASHDLQEPLRTINSYIQLLAQRYGEQLDERGQRYVGYITEASARMRSLIQDLLTYSRLTLPQNGLGSIDCNGVVADILKDLADTIAATGATITVEPLPLIRGDAASLRQIFQNLISNALKFHGADPPRIHIAATLARPYWQFAIADQGIGIDAAYFEQIFMIFQRLHLPEEYPGTGIGLALCKKLVERYGGQIWVESQSGRGSTFYFTLPLEDSSQ